MPGIGDLARDATDLLRKRTNKPDVKIDASDVKDVFQALVNRIQRGDVVSIQGLGNFRLVDRKATMARNPQTGQQFATPASKRVKFTASKTLKETVNAKGGTAPAATAAPAEKPAKAPKEPKVAASK